MNSVDLVKAYIGFAHELRALQDLGMSRKEVFHNLQFFLERKCGVDYLTACDFAERTRNFMFKKSTAKLMSEEFILKLIDVLFGAAKQKGA